MKLLFVGEYSGFAGGIERYLHQVAGLLRARGNWVGGLFQEESRSRELFETGFDQVWRQEQFDQLPADIDWVVVHKIRDAELLRKLSERYRVTVVIHDHEYYCPRRCLYFPFTKTNCHGKYSRVACGLCGMTRAGGGTLLERFRDSFLRVPGLWREICAAERIVVLSEFMRSKVIANGAQTKRVFLIPPAVALPPELEIIGKPTPPHLLFTGQLINGKGVDQLLRALPLVKGDYVLDILGAGNAEEQLRKLAEPLGDRVIFHGWSNTPETFFHDASIAVLPWRWQEPFGLVGPETMAYGIPLVGFEVGGVREYLKDNETGLLVPPGDLAGFAAAISKLLADEPRRRKMGEAGRKWVAKCFSEKTLARGWELFLNY